MKRAGAKHRKRTIGGPTGDVGRSKRTDHQRARILERLEDRLLLALDFGYVASVSGSGTDRNGRVTLDTVGNAYVSGTFSGTVDFDPTAGVDIHTATGASDGMLNKYNPSGVWQWAYPVASDGEDLITGVVADDLGAVYVVGTFNGTVDFDPGPGTAIFTSAGLTGAFLLKINPAGGFEWAKTLSGTSNASGLALASDSVGNLIVGGSFRGTIDLDPGAGTANRTALSGSDGFVAKYSPTGNLIWANALPDSGSGQVTSLAVSPADEILVGGRFGGSVTLDPLSSNGTHTGDSTMGYALKLASDGRYRWSRLLGDGVTSIAVDRDDYVLVAGSFSETFDFDPHSAQGMLTSQASDAFVAKFTTEGNYRFARGFGGLESDQANAVASDPAGNVYVAGSFRRSVDFDPGPLTDMRTSVGQEDGFALRLTAAGELDWFWQVGGTNFDHLMGLAVRADHAVVLAGYFSGTAEFNFGPSRRLTATGDSDGFLLVLTQPGAAPPVDVSLDRQMVEENATSGFVVGTFSAVNAIPGQSYTFSLLDDADGRFVITAGVLRVADSGKLDFEAADTHNIIVRCVDGDGLVIEQHFTIALLDINEAPTAVVFEGGRVPENTPAGTRVGGLRVIDPDAGDVGAFELLDDALGRFLLVGDQLFVAPDADLNADVEPVLRLLVRVTDVGGLWHDQTIEIELANINESPAAIVLSGQTVLESADRGEVIGELSAIDPDSGDVLTFQLLDDAGGRFEIVAGQLRVAAGAVFDFEASSSHSVVVRVTDAGGLWHDQSFEILVQNVNEAPTAVTLSAISVVENALVGTVIGDLAGIDPDTGDLLTFQLLDDAAGRFEIVAGQLRVAVGVDLDHEASTSHGVVVRVTDAGGLWRDQAFEILVQNVNEAPTAVTLSAISVVENALVGTVVGDLAANDPDSGDVQSFQLLDDANGRFEIVAGQLRVAAGAVFDFEASSSHGVLVRVSDAGGLWHDQAFEVLVQNVNETPTALMLSAITVAENAPAGTVVGDLTGSDPDSGDLLTFQLLDSAAGRFEIVAGQLRVAAGASLDFEVSASHGVVVRVTDAGGLWHDQWFEILVQNVNEAPTAVVLSAFTIAENAPAGTLIGDFAGVDPDIGDVHTFQLLDDAAGRFEIVAGQLRVTDGTGLDFEASTSHNIVIRATDAGGLWHDQLFEILVQNLNEAPTAVMLSAITVAENAPAGTVVGDLAANDPDSGDVLSFQLLDDANGRFEIVAGQLRVAVGAALDHETSTGHGVVVRVTDAGGLWHDHPFEIVVQNVNEAPTAVVLSAFAVAENAPVGTLIGNFAGVDPDIGDVHTFQMLDDSAGRFEIVAGQLRVAVGAALDHEASTSHGIVVRVTDAGGLWHEQAFEILVQNANEAPTAVMLSASAVAENASSGTVIGDLAGNDPDSGDVLSFQLLDDAAGRFEIVAGQLRVADGAGLDFEASASHNVLVRVTDSGGLWHDQWFEILVQNVNETPTAVRLSASSVTENAVAGTVIGDLAGIDPDTGDLLSFQLLDNAAGRFEVVAGQLRVADGAVLNFEASTSHGIVIRVTDAGGLWHDQSFEILVQNLNEAPTSVMLSAKVVMENAGFGTIVGEFTASDPDSGDVLAFQLLDDAGWRFESVGGQLRVALGAAFDFESMPVHHILVRVTDAGGPWHDQWLTIQVQNSNEAPIAGALSAQTVAENASGGTLVGELEGTDPDMNDVVTFQLLEDAGGRFEIVGAQLRIASGAVLDFETSASHAILVRVTDVGGLWHDQSLEIQVHNVNEAPTSMTLSANGVAENAAPGTLIGVLAAGDPDASEEFTFQLLDDSGGRFEIVAGQLRVGAGAALDHEMAIRHGILVRVNDAGGLWHDQAFEIQVQNVNEAPTGAVLSAVTVAESAQASTVISGFTAADPDRGDVFVYELLNDAGGLFEIVNGQLCVAAGARFDFETRTSHDILVRVTDAGGLWHDQSIVIHVQNVNEAPTAAALSAVIVAENATPGSVVGMLSASDPDLDELFTYQLQNNADGRFEIIAGQLRVSAGVNFDFEAASSHPIVVRVTDSGGLWHDQSFVVQLQDVNEPPTAMALSALEVAENAASATLVGNLTVADPDADDLATFSLLDDAEGRFEIVAGQLRVAPGATFDHEAALSHAIKIRATDAGGLWHDQAFEILVKNVNETPTAILLSANTVLENAAAGTVVGQFASLDPDTDDTLIYQLLNDAGGRFEIINGTLYVAADAVLDFESATAHDILVRVFDAGGLWHDQPFVIAVQNVNEAPTEVRLTGTTVWENAPGGTIIGELSATDPDASQVFTYQLLNNAGGRFVLSHGQLQTSSTATWDFEAGPHSHQIEVRATDAGGLSLVRSFVITVIDGNEPPQAVSLPAVVVAENTAAGSLLGTFLVIDVDSGDHHTLTLLDDAGGRLAIIGNQLRVGGTQINYEATRSLTILVRATDSGGLSLERLFVISVSGVNERPLPVIGGNLAGNEGTMIPLHAHDSSDPESNIVAFDWDLDGDGLFDDFNGMALKLPLPTAGTFPVALRVTDSAGLQSVAAAMVRVNNTAPLAADDTVEARMGRAVDLAWEELLANDWDAGSSALTPWEFENPAHGGLSQAPGGLLRYQPAAGFTGLDTFRYRITDGQILSNWATVTIHVTAVNTAPVAVTPVQKLTLSEDGAAAFWNLAGVFADSDGETIGNGLTLSLMPLSGGPLTAVLEGAKVRINLLPNQHGNATLRVRATDSAGEYAEATLQVTVKSVNDAPVAANLAWVLPRTNQPLSITAAHGLISSGHDVDSTRLTARLLERPLIRSVSIAANGAVVYTPGGGFSGLDRFRYQLHDGLVAGNVAEVIIMSQSAQWLLNQKYETIARRLPRAQPIPSFADWLVLNWNDLDQLLG